MESQNKFELKSFVAKYKKILLAFGGVVLVAIVGLLILNFIHSQPKSVVQEVSVEFTGYDGYGEAKVDKKKVEDTIRRLAYQKVGISEEHIKGLLSGDLSMSSIAGLADRVNQAERLVSGVSIDVDPTQNLKNGDTVTIKVTVDNPQQSPIKPEEKTIKVSGLKEIEKLSESDILEQYPVTFIGFNGTAHIKLPDDEAGYSVYQTPSTDESYSNGDKISLTLTDEFKQNLLTQGKETAVKTVTVEVKDLKEVADISNVKQAIANNDTLIKSRLENSSYTTYTTEALKTYARTSVQSGWYSSTENTVSVFIVTTYKVTEKQKSGDSETYYVYFGYQYRLKSDGSLDLNSDNMESIGNSFSKPTDVSNLNARLEADGYKELTVK
ncbi:hypothetical protein [Streptococcus sp. DD13]|uniref:hypothetical protein n=1 Tax=Streptococcus sp. DD13 TaxID=1777881 RepID=UPI00079CA617|nr:hypothetical protein [Streptococcus sp. DD13]KXT78528.1 hypothetical protein STRDD13_00612 [Streptococcus sp. DD13]